MNGGFFKLHQHNTTIGKEISAGVTAFLTVIYIIAVNGLILSEAGMPFEAAAAATIFASAAGCFFLALWANAPMVIVPGMGINAMFTYTFVHEMGMTWQQALGVTALSGVLLFALAFTPVIGLLNRVVPAVLKEAISIGLGFFLIGIGLSKTSATAAGIVTLLMAALLFWRKVPGVFLLVITGGTVLAWLTDTLPAQSESAGLLESYPAVFGALTLSGIPVSTFIAALFSLTMVLLFETIGIVNGQLAMARQPEKFSRTMQANAAAVAASGLLGSSANVTAVESAAAIGSGGRTGIVPLTAAVLFPLAFLVAPYVSMVPGTAIAPVLIMIGALMASNIRRLSFRDWTEWVPALAVIVIIPLTSSIADGIAAGFILYPLLKLARGQFRDVPAVMYGIAVLFVVSSLIH